MSGLTWAVLGLVMGLAVPLALFFLRARREAAPAAPWVTAAPARPATPRPPSFRAVSVTPGLDACAAVRDVAGQRLLGREAPSLPLENCDRAAHCQCRYTHFPDRRAGGDRRVPFGNYGGYGRNVGMTRESNRRDLLRERRKPKTPR